MYTPYVHKQRDLLAPFIHGSVSVLDFGCGDLTLAQAIKKVFPKTRVAGVDVVDSGVRVRGVTFQIYDGKKLPFVNKSFDTSISYHVLHHTDDPKAALRELSRVSKKTMLIVEPVFRSRAELFFMKILDRLANGWRNVVIPMPFTFLREKEIKVEGWIVTATHAAGVLPYWLPLGVTKLFVLSRVA